MGRFHLLAWIALAGSAALAQSVPPCQTRALKTLELAKVEVAANRNARAEALLEQAAKECGSSYAVLRGISETYGRTGNGTLAAVYARNAQRFTAQGASIGGVIVPPAQPPVVGKSTEKTLVRDKFALVVGIGNFRQGRIPKLKYAAKDAADLVAVLTDPEAGRFPRGNVTLLTDEHATTSAIRDALAGIAAKALKDDLVLLYFSTHGSKPAMDTSKIGSGYLITHDTEVERLYATAFGMDDLANFIRQKVSAERIVAFLDTCYSGDTTRILQQTSGSKALVIDALGPESMERIAQGKGTVVVTSSSGGELSWESDDRKNSFFTLQLMDSLRDRKGLSNIRQIFTDLQRNIPPAVRDYTKARKLGESGQGASQTPVIYPAGEIPDIVLGTPVN